MKRGGGPFPGLRAVPQIVSLCLTSQGIGVSRRRRAALAVMLRQKGGDGAPVGTAQPLRTVHPLFSTRKHSGGQLSFPVGKAEKIIIGEQL